MDREQRATLLIVEDDLGLARLQQRRLERAGYTVFLAGSAEEGARRAEQGDIDLFILDQRLPGGASGLELYQQLKAGGSNVPAILVTGLREDELLLQALRTGVRDFVPKTAEYLDYLLPAVERVLRQTLMERELAESHAQAKQALIRQRELEAEVAERKRKEQALREAQQMLEDADRRKDEFLAMLAHELRNPLAPIRNAVELLYLLAPPVEQMRPPLGMIDRQLRHLTGLVDDLLDVSRITRGKINLRKRPVLLSSVVAQAIETSRPILDERRHQFAVQLPAESVYVEADPIRLAQVILNLLNNAAKYTEERGHIDLIVEKTKEEGETVEQVAIRVRDTGIGIPAEMLPRVFDLFTQVEHTLDRSQGGLGIGLTLVRRLVEMHGGTVRAFSEGRGRGSEFVVRLPVVPKPAKASEVENAEEKRNRDVVGHHILIVDDSVDNAESLAMLLRLSGHDAQTAHDGETALEAARRRAPDIVLLDIGLPRMDGLEVARRLRQELGLKDALLIAMTGYGQEEDKRRSQDAGFNAHLTKPVELDELQVLLAQFTSTIDTDRL